MNIDIETQVEVNTRIPNKDPRSNDSVSERTPH